MNGWSSCARSLNRLSGLSLQSRNFSVIAIFLLLNGFSFSVSVTVSVIFFYFSVTVIVTVNWVIIFQYFAISVTVTVNCYNTGLVCVWKDAPMLQ